MMRKFVTMMIILALAAVAQGADWIQFPIESMGPNETQTFDITGNLDAENSMGPQVTAIILSPVGPVVGTLTITAITTIGSTFDLAEPGNWTDYSDPATLMAMTIDWSVADVSGPLTAGFITLVSSPGASGTWDLLVGHDPTSDGYLDAGGLFGTVYDGEITVGGVIPEPATLSLLALGGLAFRLRSRQAFRLRSRRGALNCQERR